MKFQPNFPHWNDGFPLLLLFKKKMRRKWLELCLIIYLVNKKQQFHRNEILSTKKDEKSFQEVHNPIYKVW